MSDFCLDRRFHHRSYSHLLWFPKSPLERALYRHHVAGLWLRVVDCQKLEFQKVGHLFDPW
jgi:hypothetical protein